VLNLGHSRIGSEHILLALAGADDGTAARILRDRDAVAHSRKPDDGRGSAASGKRPIIDSERGRPWNARARMSLVGSPSTTAHHSHDPELVGPRPTSLPPSGWLAPPSPRGRPNGPSAKRLREAEIRYHARAATQEVCVSVLEGVRLIEQRLALALVAGRRVPSGDSRAE
jgi:hypothetical protein